MKILITAMLLLIRLPCFGQEGTRFATAQEFVRILEDHHKGTNRAVIAERFDLYSSVHANHHYAPVAKELATHLRRMAREDAEWNEPKDPSALPVDERIAYLVHRFRDLPCRQGSAPGKCTVIEKEEIFYSDQFYNAARDLRRIGHPAVPVLISLLEDRRPTRSIGFHRPSNPDSYVLLRYQDIAIQVLNDMVEEPFYEETTTASYLSTESAELRASVIQSVKLWWEKINRQHDEIAEPLKAVQDAASEGR